MGLEQDLLEYFSFIEKAREVCQGGSNIWPVLAANETGSVCFVLTREAARAVTLRRLSRSKFKVQSPMFKV